MPQDGFSKGQHKEKRTRTAIFRALESERNKVAFDLQEEIAQLISAAKIRLTGETATEVNTYLAMALNKLHQLTFQLRPQLLEQFGLTTALAELVHQTLKTPIHPHRINLHELPAGMDSLLENAVFRLVQQVLNHHPAQGFKNFALKIDRAEALS
jgi:signal transduction histidine kinase